MRFLSPRRRSFAPRPAFTLLELVVVLAVIGILAGVLLPVFANAREKARSATCVSNLRQIGLAFEMYGQDYDDRFAYGGDPCDLHTTGWDGTPYAGQVASMRPLNDILTPYVSAPQVWQCPSDTGFSSCGTVEGDQLIAAPSAFGAFGMSYGYDTQLALLNESLSGVTAWDSAPPHAQHGPDHVILMTDQGGAWHGGQAWLDKRYNVLFCDGHVRFMTRAQATDLWDQTFTPPSS